MKCLECHTEMDPQDYRDESLGYSYSQIWWFTCPKCGKKWIECRDYKLLSHTVEEDTE